MPFNLYTGSSVLCGYAVLTNISANATVTTGAGSIPSVLATLNIYASEANYEAGDAYITSQQFIITPSSAIISYIETPIVALLETLPGITSATKVET